MSDEANRIVASQMWRSIDAEHDPVFVETTNGERFEMLEEFERIAVCAPEALRVLLRIEWTPQGDGDTHRCPVCRNADHRGHAMDCELDAVLRKAGLR